MYGTIQPFVCCDDIAVIFLPTRGTSNQSKSEFKVVIDRHSQDLLRIIDILLL